VLRKLTRFVAGIVVLGLLSVLAGLIWKGSQASPRPRDTGKLEDNIEVTPLRAMPLVRAEPIPMPAPAVVDEAPRVKPQRPVTVASARPEPQSEPEPQPQPQHQPQPQPRQQPPAPPPQAVPSPKPQARPEPPPLAAPSGPIDLPEAATPPRPDAGNRAPEFPETARARGLEGEVILKLVVTPAGTVGDIEVLRGGEPFASAARDAVRSWRYVPAMLDGRRIGVYKIVKVPFRLSGLR